jgi:RNA polymerase sigma factor (sigma-70 family)
MSSALAGRGTSDLAFERLYRRHRRDVYSFVLRDLRNPEDAEDVTQAAFLNAYRALQRGNEPEKPKAWLFTIAQNVTRRRFRTRAASAQQVELDVDLLVAPEAEGPTATEIRAALARLRPKQRAALVLREVAGFSYAEIADELGLSISAVETLIFRGRRALRVELEGEAPGRARAAGGLALGLPDVVSTLLSWLGRRGVAAKLAGATGAAAIATGVAVQSGALALPDTAPPVVNEPAPAAVLTPLQAPAERAEAAAPAREAKRPAATARPKEKAKAKTATVAAGAEQPQAGQASPAGALPVDVSPPSVPTIELPAVEVAIPEASVPEVVEQLPLPPLPEASGLSAPAD